MYVPIYTILTAMTSEKILFVKKKKKKKERSMLFIDRVVRLPRLHPILLEISRTRSTRCEISKFIAA